MVDRALLQGSFATAAPHDLTMEKMLLAAAIADNDVLDKIKALQPEMLYDPVHAAILVAMLSLREEKRPVNLITLKPRFGATPFATGGTVFEYIKTFEFAGAMPNVIDVVDALTEFHIRRQMLDVGERLTSAVWDQAVGPSVLLASFLREMDDLQSSIRPQGKTCWTAAEAVTNLLDNLLNGSANDRISIGLNDLDTILGGWHRSNYVVLAGRPSMGKTALAVTCARLAAKSGYGVGIFSLEMSSDQWMARTICDEAWRGVEDNVPLKVAMRNSMTDDQFDRFSAAGRVIHGLPLKIDERSGLTVEDIAAGTRHMAEEFRNEGKELRVVIVDHMGKIRPSGRYKGNRVQEVAETSNALQEIAKTERVTLIALSQLSRAVEGRDNHRPGLSDLRESGAIEQDADVIIFPYRPAYYLERAKEDSSEKEAIRLAELNAVRYLLEVNVAKQRNGPTGGIELFTDMGANAIRDAVVEPKTSVIFSGMRR